MSLLLLVLACAHSPQPAALSYNGLPSTALAETLVRVEEIRALIDLESWDARGRALAAAEAAPEAVLAWLALASAAGSREEAAAALARAEALQEQASEAERQLLAVQQALLVGDTAAAREGAETLTRRWPESVEAWLTLSRVHTARGEIEPARAAAQQALALDPDSLSAHALLGESFTFSVPRDLDRARQHYERTTELRPGLGAAWINLGDVHRAARDLDQARDRYARAVEVDPQNPIGPIKRGHVNAFLGRGAEARADYERGMALGTERDRLELATFRATVAVHEGDRKAALAELTELLAQVEASSLPAPEQRDVRAFVLEHLAAIALHQGEPEAAAPFVEALAGILRAPGAGPEGEASAAWWEARLAIARGDLEGARAMAGRFRELGEQDGSSRHLQRHHELLGLIALQAGELPQAVEHLQEVELETSLLAAHRRAAALQQLGQTEEARRLFQEVADWGFNSVDYALLRKEAAAQASAPPQATETAAPAP